MSTSNENLIKLLANNLSENDTTGFENNSNKDVIASLQKPNEVNNDNSNEEEEEEEEENSVNFENYSNNDIVALWKNTNDIDVLNTLRDEFIRRKLNVPSKNKEEESDAVEEESEEEEEEEDSDDNENTVTADDLDAESDEEKYPVDSDENEEESVEESVEESEEESEEESVEESEEESEEESNEEEEEEEEENLNNELLKKMQSYTDEELLELWDDTIDFKERDVIIKELQRRDLFPSGAMSTWEYETGSYPDIRDPEFLQKLLSKREFAESLQTTWKPRDGIDPCNDDSTFEITPVQRFVSNFLSPKTPYMSALLYHGVGVGKTCAAVQIIEAWLEIYPHKEVFLVAPPTIQQGFLRTIFDISKVVLGEGSEPNSASQCTGTTYMKLTNTLYERDLGKIEKAVTRMIRRRYKIFGYISFANYIRDILAGIPKSLPKKTQEQLKKDYLRKHFSSRFLVVDEAHNLRDITEEEDEIDDSFAGGKSEKSDIAGGKMLTPYLRDVLRYSEGMKFCALTATPMYNTYKEIIFMLNLLLFNDKKATIIESDIFDKEGRITEKGSERLSWIAQRYVSFMRGENPISFPVRLFPEHVETIDDYPSNNPRGVPLSNKDKEFYRHLPLVPIELKGDALQCTLAFMNALPAGGKGLSTTSLEKLVHAGNIIVPVSDSTKGSTLDAYIRRTDINSINTVFTREMTGGELRFRAKEAVGAKWLATGELSRYSPKFEFLINRIRNSEGCIFVYTRFIGGGALPLALALEANGYTPHGRRSTMLANGIQSNGGRQCALCTRREKEHGNSGHDFSPAYYGILTGDIAISPKNEQTIKAQRAFDNADGIKMKVIIGSQIASEGVDLRFVRETHVIDSWFHLNKTEQILGRAIRFLSHCALPKKKRNNTVYLYTAILPDELNTRETADLYSYRIGFQKAVKIGNVTRTMKQSAIDCNLNKDAIVISGQETIEQIDSQGVERKEVNINDMPFTAVCDWIETCNYKCKPEIDMKELEIDDSTYDEFSARWRIQKLKNIIRKLFERQPFYQSEDLWNLLTGIPKLTVINLLNEIVNNKTFQVMHGNNTGYVRYCNGYYLFQPNMYTDLSIPLAIRVAKFPIKRDVFTPIEYEIPEIEEEEEKVNTTRSLKDVWSAINEWTMVLSRNSKYTYPPDEIKQRRIDMSHDDSEILDRYAQILEMIEWFHVSFHKSINKNPESFRRAILFYLWDEWFTIDEHKFLMYSTDLNVFECIQENRHNLDRIVIDRFIDPKQYDVKTQTGTLHYMCEGSKECSTVIVDMLKKDKQDPLQQLSVSVRTTGYPYGFIVPKNGDLIFKTGEPPQEPGNVGRGKECANVSTMTGHISNLIQIGDILSSANKSDFDLNNAMLFGKRKIKNSTRACTLMDLFLRFLDEERINGKKWFYRPVASAYTGHKGLFRAGKK